MAMTSLRKKKIEVEAPHGKETALLPSYTLCKALSSCLNTEGGRFSPSQTRKSGPTEAVLLFRAVVQTLG